MWGLHGDAEMLDLGNYCYCLKGVSQAKRDLILTGGPWQLAGSFLSIRKWKPKFRADNDRVETTITWVRILNLPVELFRESIIETLAACVGDPLKIDGNTYNTTRGKFARFCVEIQLDVPLELGICVNGVVYQVVYENLPSVCYTCGSAGNHTTSCAPQVKDKAEAIQKSTNMETGNTQKKGAGSKLQCRMVGG